MGFVAVFLTIIIIFGSPAPKSTIILLDNDKDHNAIVVSTDKGSKFLDKPNTLVNLTDKKASPGKTLHITQKEIKKRFKDTLKATPPKAVTLLLYFKPNSTELTDASKEDLKKAIKIIQKRLPCMVDIIGHTDTTGSQKINISLSLKRAKIIKQILIDKGVDEKLLTAVGYGENDLQVETKDNIAEAKNRNVEIFIK